LVVVEAKIKHIAVDPANPDWREMALAVNSVYPPWPFIPQQVREFFSNTPIVCFLDGAGNELVNEDVQSPCVWEEPASTGSTMADRTGSQTSQFKMSFALQQSQFNGKRLFFNGMVRQKGIWIQFKLGGHMFPPPVLAKPIFVPLAPYCRAHSDLCQGLWRE
jgi:hypothetical protein